MESELVSSFPKSVFLECIEGMLSTLTGLQKTYILRTQQISLNDISSPAERIE